MSTKSNVQFVRKVRTKKPKTTTKKNKTNKKEISKTTTTKKKPKEINNYWDLLEASKNGEYKHCKTSWERGYVSRKLKEKDYPIEKYKGRYGEGYKVHIPSYKSTMYNYLDYYIKVK